MLGLRLSAHAYPQLQFPYKVNDNEDLKADAIIELRNTERPGKRKFQNWVSLLKKYYNFYLSYYK